MANYERALEALMGSEHQAQTPEQVREASQRRTRTVEDMQEYWRRIQQGQTTNILPVQRIIHVAGTKGKGSTSTMCEAICRHRYGMNTGLFTSPHLLDVRERIRINSRPVSRQVFAEAYWEVRKRLEQEGAKASAAEYDATLPILPGYFRMLTLLGLFIFGHYTEPSLDVIILEVGMGGRYDATNFLPMTEYTVVAGVTLLDFDHVRVLGHRIEEIAWEKAGIFQVVKGTNGKSSPRPFSEGWEPSECEALESTDDKDTRTFYALASNTKPAIQVLQTCAHVEGQNGQLILVGSQHKVYGIPSDVTLGLAGKHQRENAALAVALTNELYKKVCLDIDGDTPTFQYQGSLAMYQGLSEVSWPGRCQTVWHGVHSFRLDGAHTVQSIQAGLEWFQGIRDTTRPAVLLFNCSHERNPMELFPLLCEAGFDRVLFCQTDSSRPSMVAKQGAREYLEENSVPVVDDYLPKNSPESWLETLMAIWKHLDPKHVPTHCDLSAAEAIATLDEQQPAEVLVTGSLYLVGSILDALNWREIDADGSLKSRAS